MLSVSDSLAKLNQKLLAAHFWIHTVGAVTYIIAMWVSGIMQGLMWRAYDEYGTLAYTFAESVAAMHPYYVMRAANGANNVNQHNNRASKY